jgi:dATP pyrophosphohydrolase
LRLPIQVEGIVFRKTGRQTEYLMLKTTPEREDHWQPVTGGVEEEETNIEALRREVWEETGVKNILRVIENVDYYEYSNAHFVKGFDFIKEYVFGVEVDPNEKVVVDKKEHCGLRWCSFKQAMELLKWDENKKALSKLDEILKSER